MDDPKDDIPGNRFSPDPDYLALVAAWKPATKAQYQRQGDQLMRDFYECIMGPEFACKRGEYPEWDVILEAISKNPQLIVHYLELTRVDLMSATFRAYRNALVYWFSMKGLVHVADEIKKIRPDGCGTKGNPPPQGLRTSAQKTKSLPLEDMVTLVGFLNEQKNLHSIMAGSYLYLSVVFGLRPKEWYSAQLLRSKATGKSFLLVQNAKFGRGRAFGPERKIIFEQIGDATYGILVSFLRQIPSLGNKKTKEEFDRFYDRCQGLIRRAARKLWPENERWPTLYSCRHQFVANAKLKGVPLTKLAALLGHATDDTATRTYASKRKGTTGFFYVSAHPGDVARVRQVFDPDKFESYKQSKMHSAAAPFDANAFSENDTVDVLRGSEDPATSEVMRGPTPDEPDWNMFNETKSADGDDSVEVSESNIVKKPKDGFDFSPG